jgi:gamma-glutamyl-gamma-aminobutyraldehyde dehydrogenase
MYVCVLQRACACVQIFGPVMCVVPFDTEEEAVALANDSTYGLAASLHTQDISRAHRVAKAIRAGTVSVNCFSGALAAVGGADAVLTCACAEGDMTVPFGGFKQSGAHGRDKGIW